MAEESSRRFYESEAEKYDKVRWTSSGGKYADEVQRKITISMLGDISGLDVVEIGAGTGRLTQELLRHSRSVLALDISESMINKLMSRLKLHPNFAKLECVVGDARAMNLAASSADVVLGINCISHIPDYKKVYAEVYRVLRNNGKFILNFPNYLSLYLPFGLLVNARKKAVLRDVYTKWYSIHETSRILVSIGFSVEVIQGQLHIPKGVPKVFFPVVRALDKRLRTGRLKRFAPIIFLKATKLR